jgi:tetraacyldisaccharide 4'-kinase|tara:strand:+ start:1764 stop:2975 length:1212 start_codon:yes stop_codon:yes gene_type:complete
MENPAAKKPSKAELFEKLAVDVIYDRRRDGVARLLAAFLRVLSGIFWVVVKLRQRLYRARIMRASHLGCMVIVVGNLTVGGTGKTPVVEKLARSLRDRGRRVAILSRGYKSKKEPAFRKWWRWLTHQEPEKPREVSDGKNVLLNAEIAGDEPYMLAKNLPGVVVLTDRDRVKAGHFAITEYGCDTLILDDGFQYFKLQDHLQVLLIDKSNPFGNGATLPRGLLREPISHMRRASYVFLTKSDGQPDPELEATIRRYRPDVDLIECRHAPQFLSRVSDGKEEPLSFLAGKRVLAFSAIAVPESFERFVEELGAEIIHRRSYMDHHRFTNDELETLEATALESEIDLIVTTEKDAVRLPDAWKPACDVYYLRVEIKILSGVKDFEAAVSRICFPRREVRATRPPF